MGVERPPNADELRRLLASLRAELADARAERDAALEELERVWAQTARIRLAWWNPYRLVERMEELKSWRDGFASRPDRAPKSLPPPFWDRDQK